MLFLGGISLENLIVTLIVLGIAMTVHEFAHNYVGHRMGDPVPAQQGRLTLNPLAHVNWIGWLMFAMIGFGILGSAPISARRMRNPRWGFLAAVAAGPLSNLVLAIIAGIVIRIIGVGNVLELPGLFGLFLVAMVQFNVLLFVFNIIPLFPLDGWHIVLTLLPGYGLERHQVPTVIQTNVRPLSNFLMRPAYTWEIWQRATFYVLIGLIFLSFAASSVPGLPNILFTIIGQPIFSLTALIIGG